MQTGRIYPGGYELEMELLYSIKAWIGKKWIAYFSPGSLHLKYTFLFFKRRVAISNLNYLLRTFNVEYIPKRFNIWIWKFI